MMTHRELKVRIMIKRANMGLEIDDDTVSDTANLIYGPAKKEDKEYELYEDDNSIGLYKGNNYLFNIDKSHKKIGIGDRFCKCYSFEEFEKSYEIIKE